MCTPLWPGWHVLLAHPPSLCFAFPTQLVGTYAQRTLACPGLCEKLLEGCLGRIEAAFPCPLFWASLWKSSWMLFLLLLSHQNLYPSVPSLNHGLACAPRAESMCGTHLKQRVSIPCARTPMGRKNPCVPDKVQPVLFSSFCEAFPLHFPAHRCSVWSLHSLKSGLAQAG